MNKSAFLKSELTMNAVKIAKQTGKRHDNVFRDTQKMLAKFYGPGVSSNLSRPITAICKRIRTCKT